MSTVCGAGVMFMMCALVALSGHALTPKEDSADEAAYYNQAEVQGTVTILNHKELGKTPFNGAYVVFQRVDYPKSVIAVRADVNGHYELFLSKGRYRAIMRDGTREVETRDILAPSQTRFIEVAGPANDLVFNIDVLFPKQ